MTNPITPEAVERLCGNLNGAAHALHDADLDGKASSVTEAAATLRALASELAEVKAALATARAQIVAAQEGMRERADEICANTGVAWVKAAAIRALPLTDPADAP